MTEFGDIVPDNRHTRGRDRVGVRTLAAAAVSSETDADNGIGPLFTGPAVPAPLALTIPAATPVTSSLPVHGRRRRSHCSTSTVDLVASRSCHTTDVR
ncbi:hypothetical protein [Gordonia aichiensis]